MKATAKHKDLSLKIETFQRFINELQSEKITLERNRDNFQEIFIGKFWKYDRGYEVSYSYCKGYTGTYGGMGLFDFIKITDKKIITFKRDYEESTYNICQTEITEKEYNEALERFKNQFSEFVRIERKTFIEKIH